MHQSFPRSETLDQVRATWKRPVNLYALPPIEDFGCACETAQVMGETACTCPMGAHAERVLETFDNEDGLEQRLRTGAPPAPDPRLAWQNPLIHSREELIPDWLGGDPPDDPWKRGDHLSNFDLDDFIDRPTVSDTPIHLLRWCPLPDTVSEADVATDTYPSALGDHHLVMIPIGTLNPVRNQLIVLLHGGGGNPAGVRNVLSAFAQAGYRAIGLHWPEASRNDCKYEPTDAAYNDCLVDVRNSSLWDPPTGIVPQLVDLLDRLESERPFDGWGDFITGADPDWRRIILAGYSAGANQTAFAMRQVFPHGVILISAGGDIGVTGDPADPESEPLADWVTNLPENPRVVGLRNADEEHDYQRGWNAAGMPSDRVRGVQTIVDYDAFGDASRLVRTDQNASDDQAHRSTILRDIKPAHMYLACKAGGVV